MALSHAEMAIPWQKCAVHPRGTGDPSFRPDQGKFITDFRNGTRFFCFLCLNKRNRDRAKRKLRARSKPQYDLYNEFARVGIKFKPEFRLGRWPFDLGFPDLRLLVEIDDLTHDTKEGQRRDHAKEGAAREQGWEVLRVRKGPKLASRTIAAIQGYKKNIGAC